MPDVHESFVSPLSWRYGSVEMRRIWSEAHKRRLMRRVWVALAAAQNQAGVVSAAELADLVSRQDDIDLDRSLAIEQETRHDVMAELQAFAEQCPVGGRILHWGATSADITDNVDVLRIREAGRLLEQRLAALLAHFAGRIGQSAHLVVMAYTHIQPAEPTTLGYRLAVYAQDLLEDYRSLQHLNDALRGKGFKGAVGTLASFEQLLTGTSMSPSTLEAAALARLDLPAYPVTTQTYPRRQDLTVMNALAGLAASLHKFALDFRLLQSPAIGEWAEPFGWKQVGSSAMPFKRNPILAENICSLARYAAALPAVAWDNASQAILERSLDDSANRRLFLAEGFLVLDEMLLKTGRLVEGMVIDRAAVERNLARFGPFAALEPVLMALVAAGADRQEAHEWLRQASLQALSVLSLGLDNPLPALLSADERIGRYLPAERLREFMRVEEHTGSAAERALALAEEIDRGLAG